MKKEHKHESSRTCKCSIIADEPNEKCPVHGYGEYLRRCAICEQFFSIKITRKDLGFGLQNDETIF